MAKPEDRTVNTLRTISNKSAGDHQGSIVSHGGIYADENIICNGTIISKNMAIDETCKIGKDLSIGGTIYCPSMYTVIGDAIKYFKSIIPDRNKKSDPPMIGSYTDPWAIIYSEKIKTSVIESTEINTPLIQSNMNSTNIISDFNIVDPLTNCIYFKASDSKINTYCPLYQQWESIQPLNIIYDPSNILHLTTSTVFLETDNHVNLSLSYNIDIVPDNTIVTTYFVKNKISVKVNYTLEVYRCNKKCVYVSKKSMKCVKLYYVNESVYFLS